MTPPQKDPNILVILCDDMGYSDIGCFGGEIETPNLDRLAANGLRFTHFYNTPRCSPSRASLMTGLHPHQVGVGILVEHDFDEDYPGNLSSDCHTIPEVLKSKGYKSYISGKWHLAHDLEQPNGSWPTERGFDAHYGTIVGGGSFFYPRFLVRDFDNIEEEAKNDPDYYYTDAVNDEAIQQIEKHFEAHPDKPFFQYLAHTAPHWPLHAREEDIAHYKGRYDKGWIQVRKERFERMREMGILDEQWDLTSRDPWVANWDNISDEEKEWQASRMEVYAAQITSMDRGIGRILDTLEARGELDNTLILFMSDNGGCSEDFAEQIKPQAAGEPAPEWCRFDTKDGGYCHVGNKRGLRPGPENTYQSYGVPWANVSNTPFRMYKHWTHEGGIATPFIAHWPAGIEAQGDMRRDYGYLPDIMATILDLTGADYPDTNAQGEAVSAPQGTSLLPAFRAEPLPERLMFWEHEGNAAVREGHWKLVKNFAACPSGKAFNGPERGDWELYNSEVDRTEMRNLASQYPERVRTMADAWYRWAERSKVIDRDTWLAHAAQARN